MASSLTYKKHFLCLIYGSILAKCVILYIKKPVLILACVNIGREKQNSVQHDDCWRIETKSALRLSGPGGGKQFVSQVVWVLYYCFGLGVDVYAVDSQKR